MNKVECPHCRATIYDTEVICPACGKRVIKSDEEIAQEAEARIQAKLFQGSLCYPLYGDLLTGLTDELQEGERIFLSVQNEEGSMGLAATSKRLLVLTAHEVAAGIRGIDCEALPYGSIADVNKLQMTDFGTIMIGVMRIAGKPETGRRARMGQKVVTKIAGIEVERLGPVTAGLQKIVAQAHAKLEAEGKE